MSYGKFAYLYDELMKDVPYDKWVELVQFYAAKYNQSGKNLLDLGCGTGALSIRLANAGYEVTGVDLSADMLTIAQEKAEKQHLKIQFLQQNMAELDLIQTYDVIGIFCDSLNYLNSEEEVKQTFQKSYHYLEKGGLFLFDVHSLFKIEEIFLEQTYTYDEDGICYIWNCFEGDYPNSVEHELTFFVEDNTGKYDRFDENHMQRTFHIAEYGQWLEESGFEVLETIGDFQGEIDDDSERIFFIARKK